MTDQPIQSIPMTDKELTARITADLLSLPDELRRAESLGAQFRAELAAAKAALADAELTAQINAVPDGKNAEARKLQADKAVHDDPTAQAARAKVYELESAVSAAEVDAKGLVRQWSAALALCELQAAKINFYHDQKKGEMK